MRTRALLLAAALTVFLAGCGWRSAGGGSYDRNLITADDISGTAAQTAYDAVQRLQPQWLTSRGNVSITNAAATIPSVFVSGVQVGDVEHLRNILADDVAEMKYYPAGEAGARFGMGHPRGVIEVILKE